MGGTYRDLTAWQKAMTLVVAVYDCTSEFPDNERFGLVSQLRRAAISVASNIAEGKGRQSDRDLLHFLFCARGSIYEVQTQIEIAGRPGYVTPRHLQELSAAADEVARLINGLIKSVRPANAA